MHESFEQKYALSCLSFVATRVVAEAGIGPL